MAIEDDFYATVKFKYSGEEVFAKVAASEEENGTVLLLSNPITVEEIIVRGRPYGYKMEPWLKTSSEDLFVIDMDDVLTMSESSNVEMISYYQDFCRKINKGSTESTISREMGYLGSVEDTKKSLEKIFKNPVNPKDP
jgi:hypothetical protein